jgi:hypothetical protein
MKVGRCRRCGAPRPAGRQMRRRCERDFTSWHAADGPQCTRCGRQVKAGPALARAALSGAWRVPPPRPQGLIVEEP